MIGEMHKDGPPGRPTLPEIPKTAQATGAPGFNFITFMPFMVKCICISSVCSASFPHLRDKTVLVFFVNFRAFRG